MEDRFNLASYDFFLPREQIAQQPTRERDQSRLLILDRTTDSLAHRHFEDITTCLRGGDLLVMNNTRVFPARLLGNKTTGGKVEMLLLHFPQQQETELELRRATALCLIKSSKRPKCGSMLHFSEKLQARVNHLRQDGKVEVTLLYPAAENLEQLLNDLGQIPLPPYIHRPGGSTAEDVQRYQTTYARHTGSVAAPTAGLHFSRQLLDRLDNMGVQRAEVTLHVGYGTFAPVRSRDIREHVIHEEFIRVPQETAAAIEETKKAGGRIWAVGTTSARTLEYAAEENGKIRPIEGLCGLYIYPGYRFRVVDNLITNFHLPQSSLLFLVSALAGRKRILRAYGEAVEQGYRFFSYGDAMAIITRP